MVLGNQENYNLCFIANHKQHGIVKLVRFINCKNNFYTNIHDLVIGYIPSSTFQQLYNKIIQLPVRKVIHFRKKTVKIIFVLKDKSTKKSDTCSWHALSLNLVGFVKPYVENLSILGFYT